MLSPELCDFLAGIEHGLAMGIALGQPMTESLNELWSTMLQFHGIALPLDARYEKTKLVYTSHVPK